MNKIMESPSIEAVFCDVRVMSQLNLPADVPVTEMDDAMCKTNWTEIMTMMAVMMDPTPMMEQVRIMSILGYIPGW